MKAGRWKPGESGNPRGRAPGTSEVAKLRKAIARHVPEIVDRLVMQAQAGDVNAARLLLERVLPPIRATESAVPVELPESGLVAQGEAVVRAVAGGVLAPGQAAQLLSGLGTLAKLIETEELADRVAALEAERAGKE